MGNAAGLLFAGLCWALCVLTTRPSVTFRKVLKHGERVRLDGVYGRRWSERGSGINNGLGAIGGQMLIAGLLSVWCPWLSASCSVLMYCE